MSQISIAASHAPWPGSTLRAYPRPAPSSQSSPSDTQAAVAVQVAPERTQRRITAYVPILDRIIPSFRLAGAGVGCALATAIAGTVALNARDDARTQPSYGAQSMALLAGGLLAGALPFAAAWVKDRLAIRAEQRVGLWTLQPEAQLDRIRDCAIDASPLTPEGLKAVSNKLMTVLDNHPQLPASEVTTRVIALGHTVVLEGGWPGCRDLREYASALNALLDPLIRLSRSGRITTQALDDALIELATGLDRGGALNPLFADVFRECLSEALTATLVPPTHSASNRARCAAFEARLDALRSFAPRPAEPAPPVKPATPAAQEPSQSEASGDDEPDIVEVHQPSAPARE